MGFSFVNSVEGKAVSNPVTAAMDTLTAGVKLLVAHCCYFNAGTFNDDDTGANVWTSLTARTALTPKAQIHYVINPNLHAAHTFKLAGSSLFASVIVQAFTANGVITFDQESTNETTATTIQPGSITPSRNAALFVCGHGVGTTANFVVNSGFTETNEVPFLASNYEGSSLAYLIQAIAAAINPTWSVGGSIQRTSNMAVFLEAAGAMRMRQQRLVPPSA